MTMDFEALKQRSQRTWAAGDYSAVGGNLLLMSELLCEAVDLRAGSRVLDVATGSGNTALAAARRWCEVTGIDFVPALIERAKERAAAERLPITFQEGDAENLAFPTASFDVVLSSVGVMFAPDQVQAARELLRVCRAGGKIGVTAWTPRSFLAQLPRLIAPYIPPRAPTPSAMAWGTEARVRELLGDGVASLQATPRQFVFRFRSPQHFVDVFRHTFGPVMSAFRALDETKQEQLARDIVDELHRHNRSGDETLVMPCEYLEVVAVKK